jgi:hypothetical protein
MRGLFLSAGAVSMKIRATDGSSVALFRCHLEFTTKSQNPGVAPPDGAILFCWPKRVKPSGKIFLLLVACFPSSRCAAPWCIKELVQKTLIFHAV